MFVIKNSFIFIFVCFVFFFTLNVKQQNNKTKNTQKKEPLDVITSGASFRASAAFKPDFRASGILSTRAGRRNYGYHGPLSGRRGDPKILGNNDSNHENNNNYNNYNNNNNNNDNDNIYNNNNSNNNNNNNCVVKYAQPTPHSVRMKAGVSIGGSQSGYYHGFHKILRESIPLVPRRGISGDLTLAIERYVLKDDGFELFDKGPNDADIQMAIRAYKKARDSLQYPWRGKQNNCLRQICFRLAISTIFDSIILLVIFVNTVCLAIEYPGMSEEFKEQLKWLNIWFGFIFIFELIVKMIGFGPKLYFRDGFNTYDFVVVILSSVEIVLDLWVGTEKLGVLLCCFVLKNILKLTFLLCCCVRVYVCVCVCMLVRWYKRLKCFWGVFFYLFERK